MTNFAFSPSNLTTYRDCPLKFWGQSIAKTIEWKDSPAKARGTAVHEALQQAVTDGFASVKSWPEGLDIPFTQQVVHHLRQSEFESSDLDDRQLFTEKELAVNRKMQPCDFWDESVFLRARADILFIDSYGSALVGDWKTGKIWPGMDFQLRVEALLVHLIYKATKVIWTLYYVDQGTMKQGVCCFDEQHKFNDVQDILTLLKEADTTIRNGGAFAPKQNKFCRWCDWYHTRNCNL